MKSKEIWAVSLAAILAATSTSIVAFAEEEHIDNGGENGGENGVEDGGENGGDNGGDNGGENGVEDGDNGGEDGSANGDEDGGDNGVEDSGENGDEDGGDNGVDNGGEGGSGNGGEDSGDNDGENGDDNDNDNSDNDTENSGNTSDSNTVNTSVPGISEENFNTVTSEDNSSTAIEIPAVGTMTKTEVKVGEEVKTNAEGLGEVAVKTDAEDIALEGANVEVAVINKEEETSEKLNAIVGTNATEEVKSVVEMAVEAVKSGNAVTFDISFTKDGEYLQPGKDVTIIAPVPDTLRGSDKLFVYHVTDKGLENVTDKCMYDAASGTITITNNEFSPYILSKVELKAAGGNTSSDVSTSAPTSTGNPGTGIAIAVAPIVITGAAVAVVSVKKRK